MFEIANPVVAAAATAGKPITGPLVVLAAAVTTTIATTVTAATAIT